MTRAGFSYNVLKRAPAGTKPGEVEITTFVHDGKNRVTVHRNGDKAGTLADDDHAVKGSFGGGGCLSIPFNGGNKNHPGSLAELLAFRGELPAERFRKVHAALKQKYLADGAETPVISKELLGPTLTLHLSAADLAKTLKNGQSVTKWTARTGQVAIVPRIRLPGGKQAAPPTFRSSGVNGGPAVQFDGVDDLLRIVSTKSADRPGPLSVVPGTGSGQLCLFARAKPKQKDAPVVLHLVEWLGKPKPATIELRPEAFFGDRKLRMELLTPPPYDKAVHDKAEAEKDYAPLARRTELKPVARDGVVRVDVPAVRSWGLLVVSPAE
jgi:hypothetical protein